MQYYIGGPALTRWCAAGDRGAGSFHLWPRKRKGHVGRFSFSIFFFFFLMVAVKRSEQRGLLEETFWMDTTADGDELEERGLYGCGDDA